MLRRHVISMMLLLAVTQALSAQGVDLQAPSISAEEVEKAIKLKVKYLYDTMTPQNHWENYPTREAALAAGERATTHDRDWGGRTALVMLALLHAGEDWKSDRLKPVIKFLAETEFKGTYVVGIRASLWSKMKDRRFHDLLKIDAQYLIDAMTQRDETINGFFRYTKPGAGSGDHSNTQYGVLGLRDASLRGVEIARKYWEAIEQHMINLQYPNGGWAYRTSKGDRSREPYGNMTVACLANMYVTLDRLSSNYEGRFNGKSAKGCGHRKPPEAIEKGKKWLDENLPRDFRRGMNLYYLYGLERCGNASGRKTFGGLNWFEKGARWIIRKQKPDGSHNQYGAQTGTSWALLFLSKGRGAVLFNKLDTGADWQNDPLDIPNISKFCGADLEQRINWQVVDIKDDVVTWLDAPVLFFNGHLFPEFTDEQKKKLRLYTDSGGTLVAEACCSRKEFVRGFRKLAEEVWPEWELQRLDRKHPVVAEAHFKITDPLPRTFHIHDGCRSRVFLITEDVSCAWHQNLVRRYGHYFQFGMNLARYASDKKMLRNRLEYFRPWELEELRAKGRPVPAINPERGQVRMADWQTDGRRLSDIRALRHLRETLSNDCNVTLKTSTLTDHKLGDLKGVRILHMSGHHTFNVSDENLAKVRAFIDGGGMIWADAQCGRKGFNDSFTAFVKKLLPKTKLRPMLKIDPVLTGKGLCREGFDMRRVRYKQALKFNKFEAELQEVRLDGRRVILYSPHDLTCGLDGHFCWGCRGPVRNDCLKLATNIVLSAMTDKDIETADDVAEPAEETAPEEGEDGSPPQRERLPILED
jgi:Domain of unknown function (DUF4159)